MEILTCGMHLTSVAKSSRHITICQKTEKREPGKKDQIIALIHPSCRTQAQAWKSDKQVIALAMQAKKEVVPSSGNEGGGGHCTKKDPYTVVAWRLTKKESKSQWMERITSSEKASIGVAVPNIMKCTLLTKLVIMTHGKLEWINTVSPKTEMVQLSQRTPPSLRKIRAHSQQQILKCILHSSWSFCQSCWLYLARRSGKQVGPITGGVVLGDTSINLLPFITPNSNDLTSTHFHFHIIQGSCQCRTSNSQCAHQTVY